MTIPLKTNFTDIKAEYEAAHPLQRVGIVFYPFIFDVALPGEALVSSIETIKVNIERTVGGLMLQAAGFRLACERCDTELRSPRTDTVEQILKARLFRLLCVECAETNPRSTFHVDGKTDFWLRRMVA